MPQTVRHSVHCGWQPCSAVPEHVACFLRLQVSEPVKAPCSDSVVYMLGGRHNEVYVGYSSHLRASKNARLGAPLPRVNEHFYEAACVSTSAATCAKTRLLKVESPCDLGALVVLAGPDLQARTFEKILIACLQPALNTAWHGPTMGKLRKNNMSHGAAPRRRPSKHIRQAREAQAHAVQEPHHVEMSRLVQLDVRRRAGQVHQHANESACVSLLSRRFPVIYALCLAAHVRDTNTYGPINVIGQFSPLLVAWICYCPAVVQ